MTQGCLFCRMIRREIPTTVVYEDDRAFAFRDINPQAATHVLVVPKRHVPSIDAIAAGDEAEVGHLFAVAAQIAAQEGLTARGYRTVMNCGDDAGQTVYHLHLHVLGGAPMGWPPFPVR
jgi:histidine triad (HIT) family protein